MSTWSLQCPTLTLTFTSTLVIPPSDTLANRIMTRLHSLHEQTPLVECEVKQDSEQPERYSYEFTTADGRKWEQNLFIRSGVETMTFAVSDEWKVSEFIVHRELRDDVFAIIKKYQVTDILAEWSP
jgi:hypothetical protein